MYFIIETKSQLDKFLNFNHDELYINPIMFNDNFHPKLTDLSLLYIHTLTLNKSYIISLNHSEALSIDKETIYDFLYNLKSIYTTDKKQFQYFFSSKNVYDLNLVYGSLPEIKNSTIDYFYKKYNKLPYVNKLIPITKHYEKQNDIFDSIRYKIENYNIENQHFINKNTTNIFYLIEKNGIKIDKEKFFKYFEPTCDDYSIKDNTIYSNYHLFTSTRRPSNNFNNINFTNMNKEDSSRECIIPKNDLLLEIDYKSYHLYLLSQLIDMRIDEDIYDFLSKELKITDRKEIKNATFNILYTSNIKNYLHIDFFKKVNEFKLQKWDELQTTKSIKGYNVDFSQINRPSKLLPYILQYEETKNNTIILTKILKLLHEKKTELILYVYDSFLFDVDKEEIKEIYEDIIRIFKNEYFKLHVKIGTNYKNLKEI